MIVLIQQAQALDAKAFQARCAEFSKARDWKGLEALARAQVAANPKDAEAFSALGYALFAQDRGAEGRGACESALKLDPKQIQALIYLGMEDAREGKKAELLSVGSQLKAIQPELAIRFWCQPSVLLAILPDNPMPVVDESKVTFTKQSLQSLFDRVGPVAGPLAVAMVFDEQGFPTYASALVSPPGVAKMALEQAVMHWRIKPVQIEGKPRTFGMLIVIRMDTTVVTTTTTR